MNKIISFAVMCILLSTSVFAQLNENEKKSVKSAALSAVSGASSYKLLKKETLVSNTYGGLVDKDLLKLSRSLRPNDKIVIEYLKMENGTPLESTFRYERMKAANTQEVMNRVKKIGDDSWISQVIRKNDSITIQVIKRANFLKQFMLLMTLGSLGSTVYYGLEGRDDRSSAQFNGSRSVPDKVRSSTELTTQRRSASAQKQ